MVMSLSVKGTVERTKKPMKEVFHLKLTINYEILSLTINSMVS